jgi:hypothetical protein
MVGPLPATLYNDDIDEATAEAALSLLTADAPAGIALEPSP